jgi:hypothetical protein
MRRTGVDMCGSCIQTFGTRDSLMWFPESHQGILHELAFRISLFLPAVLVRADVAKAHPYNETLTYSDFALLAQFHSRYRLGNLPQILLKCRYHAEQIHVVHDRAFSEDQRAYRAPYFRALFPEATAEDVAAFEHLAEGKPFANPSDLERAGGWLVRLAKVPEPFLRRQMAARWMGACARSAHLGIQVLRLYRRIAPEFEAQTIPGAAQLWLACALRLRAGSRLQRSLRNLRLRLKRSNQWSRRANRAPVFDPHEQVR